MKVINSLILTVFILLSSPFLFGQDQDMKLAEHYFQRGEFDKAEVYYKKLVTRYNSHTIYDRYFLTLYYQEKFDECEKILEKWIKKDPYTIDFRFKLGAIYEVTDRVEQAEKEYNNLLSEMPAVQSRIEELGNRFKSLGKYEYALQAFLSGKKMLKGGYGFQIELAELYMLLNRPADMISEYIGLLEYSSNYLKTIQTFLSRAIDFDDEPEVVDMLRRDILTRVQKNPESEHRSEEHT